MASFIKKLPGISTFFHQKTPKNDLIKNDLISNLPDEALIEIFSNFNLKTLFLTVNQKWKHFGANPLLQKCIIYRDIAINLDHFAPHFVINAKLREIAFNSLPINIGQILKECPSQKLVWNPPQSCAAKQIEYQYVDEAVKPHLGKGNEEPYWMLMTKILDECRYQNYEQQKTTLSEKFGPEYKHPTLDEAIKRTYALKLELTTYVTCQEETPNGGHVVVGGGIDNLHLGSNTYVRHAFTTIGVRKLS